MADRKFTALEHPDGLILRTGCVTPEPEHDYARFPKLSAAANLIDPSRWGETDLGMDAVPVLYQTQNGCVGHGGTSAFWIAFIIAHGVESVPPSGFSPTSLYAMVNGGRDQGAYVSDAMDALMQYGVCRMDQFPESKYFAPQLPAEAKETRKRYRVRDAFHCDTFAAIGTAVVLGYPVPFGVSLPYGYNGPLDADGVLVRNPLDPTAGHCMMAYGTTRLRSGEPALKVRNSWSDRWGNKGNCLMVAYHFGDRTDAFAIRAAQVDPQDPHQPPIAIG